MLEAEFNIIKSNKYLNTLKNFRKLVNNIKERFSSKELYWGDILCPNTHGQRQVFGMNIIYS